MVPRSPKNIQLKYQKNYNKFLISKSPLPNQDGKHFTETERKETSSYYELGPGNPPTAGGGFIFYNVLMFMNDPDIITSMQRLQSINKFGIVLLRSVSITFLIKYLHGHSGLSTWKYQFSYDH